MAGQDDKKANGDNAVSNNLDPTDDAQNTDVNISEEYNMLDSKLDELNSALDFLEQKNDDIHERLKDLLKSNIDIRQEMQNQNVVAEGSK